jgi:hypothetical protein
MLINTLTPQAIELVLMARRRDGSVERINLLASAKTNIEEVIERSKAWRDRCAKEDEADQTTQTPDDAPGPDRADPPED